MKFTKEMIMRIIKEEINEAFGPDSDYLDKLKYKKDHGVPNPEVAASNARIAAAKEKQKEIDKVYLDILKTNPEADRLFDAIQDYGYNNNFDVSGAEDMLQQFLSLFPEGPVRERAKNSVTYFH
tara:strand:- start:1811 stop:2182 length:372 start_codon:yes stop_codon:yes gene_type:complete